MVKLAPKTKTAAVAASVAKPVGQAAVRNLSARPLTQMIVVLHGMMAAGKTFLAASASEHWVPNLPAPKQVELSDMLWLQADRGACDGFRHNHLDVPIFDFVEFMYNEGIWRHAVDARGLRFTQPPTIIQAMEFALNLVKERFTKKQTTWVVVDTLTTLDTHMLAYHQAITAGDRNKYAAYLVNLKAHRDFHTKMCVTGANVIYICHSKAIGDEDAESEVKKAISVQVAGGARFFPDLTGQAPKIYKHDDSLQIVVQAKKEPNRKRLNRQVLIGLNESGGESKNRFEGLLNEVEEFNLRNILKKAGWVTDNGDKK